MAHSIFQLLFTQPHLTKHEAEDLMDHFLEEGDPHQTAALLAILKYRGETVEEVEGMLASLRKKALPTPLENFAMDIVGTGGDLAHTVNISTGSALLAAACGIPILKLGNRSVSSRCGSADFLEALGIEIELYPKQLFQCLHEVGISFLYAPFYHPALKKMAAVRKGFRLPTTFNMLGPLLHPAKVGYALIGVGKEEMLPLLCEIIQRETHRKRTLVFHGGGLDELTTLGVITAYDVTQGNIAPLEIDPAQLGFRRCVLEELQGGEAKTNAAIITEALGGKKGAVADTLVLNAGAALWIFGKKGTLQEGIERAREVQMKGRALEVLDRWRTTSKKLKEECL